MQGNIYMRLEEIIIIILLLNTGIRATGGVRSRQIDFFQMGLGGNRDLSTRVII